MLIYLAILIALIGAALAYYAWFIEPYRLVIRRKVFEVEGLDPSGVPITILHISDLHMRNAEHRKAKMLEPLKKLQPDLVIITGDFVQSTGDARYCAGALRGLQAKHGVLGVLGNHDHFRYSPLMFFRRTKDRESTKDFIANDAGNIIRLLEDAGIKILDNANLRYQINGHEFWVLGVDDPHHHRADLEKALAGIPQHAVKILLAHSPDIIDEAARAGIRLVFTGHTHGGQVRFPLIGALVTRTSQRLERPSGIIHRNGTTAYISQGIGGGTLTLRFLCPPEATIVELVPRGAKTSDH